MILTQEQIDEIRNDDLAINSPLIMDLIETINSKNIEISDLNRRINEASKLLEQSEAPFYKACKMLKSWTYSDNGACHCCHQHKEIGTDGLCIECFYR